MKERSALTTIEPRPVDSLPPSQIQLDDAVRMLDVPSSTVCSTIESSSSSVTSTLEPQSSSPLELRSSLVTVSSPVSRAPHPYGSYPVDSFFLEGFINTLHPWLRVVLSWLPVFGFVIFMLGLMTLAGGCTSIKKEPYDAGVLRMNLGNEPPSLDWHVTTDFTSFDVISNIMVGLTQYRSNLTCAPAIAETWEILDGGTRYVFHLRDPKETFWTDGKGVTAHDFEYAWKRLAKPETGGAYANFLYDVVNGLEINTGKIKDVNQLGVKALDDRTLEVRLKKPIAYFIYLTAHPSLYPMRKDMVEQFGDRWTEPGNIITNGPFALKKWQHEYKIELAANPSYFEGTPKLHTIKMFMIPELSTAFSLFENDELDYVDNRSFSNSEINRCKKLPNYKNIPILSGAYIGFNVKKPPMDDPRVRKAIAYSIDKSMFPKILRREERPIGGWIPPGMCGYNFDSGLPYDPAKGRELLAQAGYPDGKDFPAVPMLYPNREDTKLIVEAIQANLKKDLNIHVELMAQEWKVYLSTKRRDPPALFRATWGADFPDTDTFMSLFTTHNGNNCTKWSDPKYDDLIARAAVEQDFNKRQEIYRQADKMLCQDAVPLVPTYLLTQNVLTKPWAHNLLFTALDIQYFKGASVGEGTEPSLAPIDPPPAGPDMGAPIRVEQFPTKSMVESAPKMFAVVLSSTIDARDSSTKIDARDSSMESRA